jgi:hypothetical protein
MQEIKLKRGDTLYLVCTYSDNNDVAIDLTNVSIESNVMSSVKEHITALVITKLDQVTNTGKFSITAPVGFTFPVGKHLFDIQYTENGFVQSTDTMHLTIIEDVS